MGHLKGEEENGDNKFSMIMWVKEIGKDAWRAEMRVTHNS